MGPPRYVPKTSFVYNYVDRSTSGRRLTRTERAEIRYYARQGIDLNEIEDHYCISRQTVKVVLANSSPTESMDNVDEDPLFLKKNKLGAPNSKEPANQQNGDRDVIEISSDEDVDGEDSVDALVHINTDVETGLRKSDRLRGIRAPRKYGPCRCAPSSSIG